MFRESAVFFRLNGLAERWFGLRCLPSGLTHQNDLPAWGHRGVPGGACGGLNT